MGAGRLVAVLVRRAAGAPLSVQVTLQAVPFSPLIHRARVRALPRARQEASAHDPAGTARGRAEWWPLPSIAGLAAEGRRVKGRKPLLLRRRAAEATPSCTAKLPVGLAGRTLTAIAFIQDLPKRASGRVDGKAVAAARLPTPPGKARRPNIAGRKPRLGEAFTIGASTPTASRPAGER